MAIHSFICFLLVATVLWWKEASCFMPFKGIPCSIGTKTTFRSPATVKMVVNPNPSIHPQHQTSLQHDVVLAVTATALALAVSLGNPMPLLHGDDLNIMMQPPHHHSIYSSTQIVSTQQPTILGGGIFDPFGSATRQILRAPTPLSLENHDDASLPHQGLSHGLRARLRAQEEQFQKYDSFSYRRNDKNLQAKSKFSWEQQLNQESAPGATTMPTFET